MGWPPLEMLPGGLRIAATCTLAAAAAAEFPPAWTAAGVIAECCRALAGSFKISNTATVGGNVCLALPAVSMTSLTAALDGTAELWAPDGSVRHLAVADLVLGDRRTALAPGEVLRAITLGDAALRATTAFRRTSLSRLGRSASLVIARRDLDGGFVLTVTAATERPVVLRYPAGPPADDAAGDVERRVDATCGWFDDVHGAPDWRRATTLRSVAEVCGELS